MDTSRYDYGEHVQKYRFLRLYLQRVRIVGAIAGVLPPPRIIISQGTSSINGIAAGTGKILIGSVILFALVDLIRNRESNTTRADWMKELEVLIYTVSRAVITLFVWLLHFLVRLCTRVLILLSVPGLIILMLLAGIVLILVVHNSFQPISDQVKAFAVAIFAIVAVIGSSLLTKFRKEIGESMSEIMRNITYFIFDLENFKEPKKHWEPNLGITSSLSTTWSHLGHAVKHGRDIVLSALVLWVSGVMLTILLFVVDASARGVYNFQTNVKDSIERIQKKLDDVNITSEEQVPVVYSLVYPPQANLKTKAGICPGTSSGDDKLRYRANLDWLKRFKTAISECSRKESRLKLVVRAYASVAPVSIGGRFDRSDDLNCEMANQRAEAVVRLLTTDKDIRPETCERILGDEKQGFQRASLCKPRIVELTVRGGNEANFDVTYRPWHAYCQMTREKPVDDERDGGNARPELEFLNRVVQIIVTNDPCWRGGWVDSIQDIVEPTNAINQ